MSTWYIRIGVPSGEIHLYEIGEADDPVPLFEEHRGRVYAELGVPDDWLDHPGWDVSLIDSPVHPKLLAIAIMHPLPDDGD